ncbi:MAG: 50S ribosomal protein L6 [Candidatus Paceibacterota bacterium]|jgi:large subunit ribosomal protein L6
MSRIGKKSIQITPGVEVKFLNGIIEVKGPKGFLKMNPVSEVEVVIEEKEIKINPKINDDNKSRALWGLTRTLIANMIEGVTKGFEKKMEINGVGFKARVEGKDLILDVGFSHPVKISAPENISFLVEKNIITVSGIDKELVGQISASIRRIRPPEPYKGKGIKYTTEIIRKKLGKKAAGAG